MGTRWHPWRGLGGLPREVWILFTASLVNRAGTMVLPFFVLYLTREGGFSAKEASLYVLLYGVGSLAAAPVSGRLSDLLGPIRIMRASLLVSGVAVLLFPFARGTAAVAAMTFLFSFTSEAFRPANLTIFGELVPADMRKAGFAVNRLAVNLGMSVGPALGGFLATISFRWLFLVDGVTALAAGTILLLARFPPHRRSGPPDTGDFFGAGTGAPPPAPPSPRGGHRDRRLILFLAAVFPINFVFFQHISSMPLFLVQNLGLTAAAYGLLFTVNTLLIVFLEVPLNLATSHWSHRRTICTGAVLCAFGFGSLAGAWNFWSAAVTVVVWTFGEMLIFPGIANYLTEIAPPARRGEYMGYFQMTVGLAFTVGPWAGLQILAVLGGRALWLIMLGCGLAAAAMLSAVVPATGAGNGKGETGNAPSNAVRT